MCSDVAATAAAAADVVGVVVVVAVERWDTDNGPEATEHATATGRGQTNGNPAKGQACKHANDKQVKHKHNEEAVA